MHMIKLLKVIAKFGFTFFGINWWKFIFRSTEDAKIVVWLNNKSWRYFIGEAIVWDFATIDALLKRGIPFRVITGRKKVGKLRNKYVFFSPNNAFNVYGFSDYTDILRHLTFQLEKQGNQVMLSSYEVQFLENKAFMHKRFEEFKVSTPKTEIFHSAEEVLGSELSFPFLIKAEHSSGSRGLYKITSKQDLERLFKESDFLEENEHILVQDILNMRKDLRVILVGNEIVHFYWRINTSDEWKPTSTSHGSKVDFVTFPEQWRAHIIETFKRLKLRTGAFDIAWQNDDLNTTPMYLEVSPSYQPNPKLEIGDKDYAYFKKGFSITNSYERKYVNTIFSIRDKIIGDFINNEYNQLRG